MQISALIVDAFQSDTAKQIPNGQIKNDDDSILKDSVINQVMAQNVYSALLVYFENFCVKE